MVKRNNIVYPCVRCSAIVQRCQQETTSVGAVTCATRTFGPSVPTRTNPTFA